MSDIYPQYQEFARNILMSYHKDDPRVLKTDCHNEARTDYPILPEPSQVMRWTYVDINGEIIAEARKKYPHIIISNQDIRYMSFSDDTIDIVMDFSTIDHIPDYQKALDEYKRVLTKRGRLLVVVWLDDEARHVSFPNDAGQYYFAKGEFAQELNRRFLIHVKTEYDNVVGGNGILTKFICEKI